MQKNSSFFKGLSARSPRILAIFTVHARSAVRSKETRMKRLPLFSFSVVLMAVYAAFAAPAVAQHEHEHPAGDPGKLGKVNFPISCDPAVQPQFSGAVAMLHSFWYEKASDTFAAAAQKDPACGMAYWGIAMTDR